MKSGDMVRTMLGAVALTVGMALLFGGCADPKDRGPQTTVPTAAPSTAPAPPAPDVTKVPAVIDAAYVNAVLAALDEVDGQATRLIVAARKLEPEAGRRLQAIYSVEQLQLEVERRLTGLAQDPELKGILPNPGNQRTTVERIIAATPTCLWLAVRRDYSKVNVDPSADRTEYVGLQPLDPRNNPGNANPTPWVIFADGLRRDGTEPANPCP